MPGSSENVVDPLGAAYLEQLEDLDRQVAAGRRLSGWKVGAVSPATRPPGFSGEPVAGFLLHERELHSPAEVAHATLTRPLIECELCLTLRSELAGPFVDSSEALAAIGEVRPAVEIVERRLRGSLEAVVADNSQQWGYVIGDPVPAGAVKLDAVAMEVLIDGELAQTGISSDVMGNPANSLAWLSRHLSRYGRRLRPGDQVMSGSLAAQLKVERGAAIEVQFSGVGEASIRFV
jgi:2-keto-4-pentenoate hydratase